MASASVIHTLVSWCRCLVKPGPTYNHRRSSLSVFVHVLSRRLDPLSHAGHVQALPGTCSDLSTNCGQGTGEDSPADATRLSRGLTVVVTVATNHVPMA